MKFTPLTTRPSLTSRHGMTRTLNIKIFQPGRERPLHSWSRSSGTRLPYQLQRRARIQIAAVEGAARDRAAEFSGARGQQRLHVRHRAEPAGGDDRDRDRVGERNGGIEIEPLEQAVAG